MADTPQTRDQVSAAIAEKAWKDEAFHQEVLANPNKVFEDHFGEKLPPGVAIKVVEDTPHTVHFVLPAKPANARELSDSELETVAGGATPFSLISAAVSAGVLTVGLVGERVGTKYNW